HHLLLASDERGRFGPAAMMRARDNLVTQWQSEPRWLGQRQLDSGTEATIPAANWQQVTSDAGWAGVLAQAAMDPKRPDCFVIFESGQDVLALFDESLALLPPEQRWRVSFSTFFAKLPPGMSCQWRAVLQGSAEHRAVPPHNRVVRIDLTTMSRTEDSGPLIQRARTGKATTQAKPDEPVATPVPPSPPPESADHPHLPAFQDSPPILNATSERQPSRSSSKPIILIAAMCLMVTFLALAGFLASYLTKETARPAEPTSDVSSPPL
ncbi:unnamed protein product, partial [Hapterophycus canaliculatus]